MTQTTIVLGVICMTIIVVLVICLFDLYMRLTILDEAYDRGFSNMVRITKLERKDYSNRKAKELEEYHQNRLKE